MYEDVNALKSEYEKPTLEVIDFAVEEIANRVDGEPGTTSTDWE